MRLLAPFGGSGGGGGNTGDKLVSERTSPGREKLVRGSGQSGSSGEGGGRLYPAVSDSQLHSSVELYRRRQQIVDSSGRIITQVEIKKLLCQEMLKII
jgi:hypothetical protein